MNEGKSKSLIDRRSTGIKNILHGFFLNVGMTVAEPATVLPLIVTHFGGSGMVVGLFASLIRGGAVVIQMFAAYHAQSSRRVMPLLRRVYAARFIGWFGIGVAILSVGDAHPTLTLWLMGLGLFLFSFAAGFGQIYFKEIQAKVFTHRYRGKSMGHRQFWAALGSIGSGGIAGFVLQAYEAPLSYALLFMGSALIMLAGMTAFATIAEPIKNNIRPKEGRFSDFLRRAFRLLREERTLQIQIAAMLLSYGYLFALPFLILDAKERFSLDGWLIGVFISAQMGGAMFGSLLWGKLSFRGKNRLVVRLSFALIAAAMVLALIGGNALVYGIVFCMLGAAADGMRLAFHNLILILAPEEKRPIYVALQANIASFGLFFPLLGGILQHIGGFVPLYLWTMLLASAGLWFSGWLKDVS